MDAEERTDTSRNPPGGGSRDDGAPSEGTAAAAGEAMKYLHEPSGGGGGGAGGGGCHMLDVLDALPPEFLVSVMRHAVRAEVQVEHSSLTPRVE